MNMLSVLARAFGVDPVAFGRLVEAYENPDRLTLIEARWREAGCGDTDKTWLIAEVKRWEQEARTWRSPQQILRLDAEARAEALEAECRRLREAMMKPEQIKGLARFVAKYGDLDKDSHALAPLVLEQIAAATEAALTPPEAQGREEVGREPHS